MTPPCPFSTLGFMSFLTFLKKSRPSGAKISKVEICLCSRPDFEGPQTRFDMGTDQVPGMPRFL